MESPLAPLCKRGGLDLVGARQYGTVKQKMQDFSTRECGVQAPDRDLLGLNRTVLGCEGFMELWEPTRSLVILRCEVTRIC
jgi:hypothetical protein